MHRRFPTSKLFRLWPKPSGAYGPSRFKMPAFQKEEYVSRAQSAEHLEIHTQDRIGSAISARPSKIRGQVLGTISFSCSKESGRHFTQDDLKLAEDLGYRAGFAVENSRLYFEAQNINQIKDEFLATLSHELRTPLNVILGHAEILMQDKGSLTPDERQFSLRAIHRNAGLQTQIVQDLLDVSSIITGKISI